MNRLVYRNKVGYRKKAEYASLVDGEYFYTHYPMRSNEAQLVSKRGCFEDLSLYCGFSFNRSENVAGMASIEDKNSIFDWSTYLNHIDKANIRGAMTFRDKQLKVVGYFFEMRYDICLSPIRNVLNNSGFETILGVFYNTKKAYIEYGRYLAVVVG